MKKIGLNTVGTFSVEMTEEEIELVGRVMKDLLTINSFDANVRESEKLKEIQEDLEKMTGHDVHRETKK